MTEMLFLLRMPQAVRLRYRDGMRAAFPDMTVNVVDDHDKVGPYIATADVLATFGPMARDAVFQSAPRLKWVQALGTGVDGIVDQPSLGRDVIVTNMHGFQGPPVAEAALLAMLAQARGFVRALRNQAASHWERWPARTLAESTVGIFGVGAIAADLAPRCKALGMKVIGISASPREVPGFDRIVARSDLHAVLPELDWLVLLVPSSAQTRGVVDASVFAAMKPTSHLVNLARGDVVDEAALLAALREGQIAGAALDVFHTEPLPPSSPFWLEPNVIVTAHGGGFFDRYPDYALPIIEKNMRHFLAGETDRMINLVKAPS